MKRLPNEQSTFENLVRAESMPPRYDDDRDLRSISSDQISEFQSIHQTRHRDIGQ
jgi:hypothetical protein